MAVNFVRVGTPSPFGSFPQLNASLGGRRGGADIGTQDQTQMMQLLATIMMAQQRQQSEESRFTQSLAEQRRQFDALGVTRVADRDFLREQLTAQNTRSDASLANAIDQIQATGTQNLAAIQANLEPQRKQFDLLREDSERTRTLSDLTAAAGQRERGVDRRMEHAVRRIEADQATHADDVAAETAKMRQRVKKDVLAVDELSGVDMWDTSAVANSQNRMTSIFADIRKSDNPAFQEAGLSVLDELSAAIAAQPRPGFLSLSPRAGFFDGRNILAPLLDDIREFKRGDDVFKIREASRTRRVADRKSVRVADDERFRGMGFIQQAVARSASASGVNPQVEQLGQFISQLEGGANEQEPVLETSTAPEPIRVAPPAAMSVGSGMDMDLEQFLMMNQQFGGAG